MSNDITGYNNLLLIARGGMGEVYKAVHSRLGKEVILKKLQGKAPKGFNERFKREASIMMEVSHPNIVHIFDYFKEGNSSYIAMEYIEGFDLARLIKKHKKFPVYMAAYIIYEVAKGLRHAHDKEIIHRDIKPGNVLISKKGEVKLTDFGIAFKSDRKKGEELTKTGTLLGTPAYMSPEQIHSSKDVDSRSDIYSLGILFYELLTGIRPYSNEFTMENITRIRKGHCPSIRSKNSRVPSKLVRIIKKAMHPRKSRRYQTAGALVRVLEPFLLSKFKSLKNLNSLFSDFINNEDESRMAKFRYPLYKIVLHRAGKIAAATVAALALLKVGCFLFPTLFAQALPGRYGLLEVSFSDKKALHDSSLKLSSPGKQGRDYYIFSALYRPFGYKIKRLLPAGSYNYSFPQEERLLSGTLIVYPFKGGAKSLLSLDTAISEPHQVKIELLARQPVESLRVERVKMQYRVNRPLPPEDSWKSIDNGDSLEAGKSYDFLISAPGYNDTLLKAVALTRTRSLLKLEILLSPELVKISLPAVKEGYNLKIDGEESGNLDSEGIKKGSYRFANKAGEFYLTPGRHKIELIDKDKVLFSKSFNITKESKLLLNISTKGAPFITLE